jgi:DNA polymerase III epsilon subunit-like protein
MSIDPDICFISVDVEASGPIPGVYSMLSLGACSVDNDQTTFKRLIRPISEEFDPKALEVSKLSLKALKTSGKEPKKVMRDFREWIVELATTRTPVFVGLNAAFDWSFVNYYFYRYLGENPFGFAPLDIKAFYAGVTGSAWMEARSSRMISRLGATKRASHDALEDAVAQAELFRLTRNLVVRK